ncbi:MULTISPECIES: peptidoglycan editing factor PgeF [unclassified Acinetobacter]|uniref:peptidoglycan editing factor PgeF n=1 Tax=unclassified Acinetobacter TaxID=196816 RepID=UPI0035BAF6C9
MQNHSVDNKAWLKAQNLPSNVYAGQTFAISDEQVWKNMPQDDYLQHNFALHVGDHPQKVQQQRMKLLNQLSSFGVQSLHWLNQTHSTTVHRIGGKVSHHVLDGDAWVTQQHGVGLVIMTADCMPIVLCDKDGREVACLHAGWRGLLNGMIEQTVQEMQYPAHFAWMGVAISQANFEVGAEVREAFVASDADFAHDFIVKENSSGEKYLADLYSIARKKLRRLGVQYITGGDDCSFANPNYYSYRRNAKTGRMVTFVFIAKSSQEK